MRLHLAKLPLHEDRQRRHLTPENIDTRTRSTTKNRPETQGVPQELPSMPMNGLSWTAKGVKTINVALLNVQTVV